MVSDFSTVQFSVSLSNIGKINLFNHILNSVLKALVETHGSKRAFSNLFDVLVDVLTNSYVVLVSLLYSVVNID